MKKFTCILVLSLLLSCFASCTKKQEDKIVKTPTYVDEEITFYDAVEIHPGEDYLRSPDYGAYEVMVSSCAFGENYFMSDAYSSQWDSEEQCAAEDHHYLKYDYEGNLLESACVNASIGKLTLAYYSLSDEFYMLATDYYQTSGVYTVYKIDFDTSSFVEVNEFSLDDDRVDIDFQFGAVAVSENEAFLIGIYTVDREKKGAIISVNSDAEFNWCKTFDFSIWQISLIDNDRLLINSNEGEFYEYNSSTNAVSKITLGEEYDSKYSRYIKLGYGGKIYSLSSSRIDAFDVNTMSESTFLDYNFCGVDMNTLGQCYPIVISEDRIVMDQGSYTIGDIMGLNKLVVLSKADTNPYAGRPVIEVAQMWGINSSLGQGVLEYNRSQQESFAYITGRYNEDFVVPEIYGDDYTVAQKTLLIDSQLMLDIVNGEGPDVIVGLGDTTQLNTSKYLIDFDSFIENDSSFNKEDYFVNVLEAYRNTEGLFQIPLQVTCQGLLTSPENGYCDGMGFTYDNYRLFVSEYNEGADPLAVGRTRDQYFHYVYMNNSDLFFTDGQPNFDCEAFRAMAEYAKNDVTENGITPYAQSYESQIVSLCSFYDEYQYERWVRYGWDLYGCISTEERGPILEIFDTVAIVSTTSDQDACWNLAKCMLSEDVQVNSYYNPINIAAFYRYVDNCIYAINQERIFYSADYGNIFEITEEDIENYRAMLESADHTNAIDSEIYAIVCEEIQAYFDGSKTLDQVIEIINSRAQLVIDERG